MTNAKKYDIIIPVPVHRKRRSERGYNQTELIAKELANNLKITYSSSSLIKDKNIKPLSSMGAKERKNQIKNVFKVKNIESIKGKKCLKNIIRKLLSMQLLINMCH